MMPTTPQSPGLIARLRSWWAKRREPTPALNAVPDAAGPPETLVFRAALADLLLDRKRDRRSRNWRTVVLFLMFALPPLIYGGALAWSAGYRIGSPATSVAVIRLEGQMAEGEAASAERIVPALRKAFASDSVRAIVLAIDSPGGAPLEAERIYTAIADERKAHPKPVVAVINNLGASAAYMVAMHTDRIYAGNYSLVGSIGGVMSGWDGHEALARLGVSYRVYASGSLKASMNPFVPMTPEAERKARELVTQLGRAFREELEQLRRDRLAAGVDFGTGEVWGGSDAKRLGLVDEISTLDQVLRTRWPDVPVQEFGPRAEGLLSSASVGAWLQGVMVRALGQPMALR